MSDAAADEARRLARTWNTPPGLLARLAAVDHKIVARRYLVTALAFLLLGGLLAMTMRLQLAWAENDLLGPDRYNQVFTMHGSTMMFLFAVPVMEGLAIYLVPLMVGARSIAFPRLVAFSYWVYLFGGVFLWTAFAMNAGADVGWFSYVPLAGPQFTPGKRADVWAQLITYTELSALAVAVAIIVTVLKLRAPGMSLDRIPVFVWAMLVMSCVVLIAMPAVMLASTMLILDRLVGTHFFNPAESGDVLLFQHIFWFFGHPEVYIIFIPATGIVSAILPAFVARPIFGYPAIVASLAAIGLLSFGLWVHHMFTTGLPKIGESFFTAASMLIAVPSGIQVFCWIATLWLGRPRLEVPLLYVLGFLFTFVIGGMTGVMVASVPIDTQVHDTYFVVAHFHYVLIGGAVFPLLGGLHFWFPKLTGRMADERLGRWSFWLVFAGFNLTFFPMHFVGLQGMPRRVYTYPANLGWDLPNGLSSAAALMLFCGFAVFFLNLLRSRRRGAAAADDPWKAGTLEWATASPPPAWNFTRLPVVRDREPLWHRPEEARPVATGLRADMRQLLVTSASDARPERLEPSPTDSIWPLVAGFAVGMTLLGSIFTPWAIVWGAAPVTAALTAWFWPRPVPEDQ